MKLWAVGGHRELERVVVRLALRRVLNREEPRVELFHAGDELFERLCARVRFTALRSRERNLVERHTERLEARLLLVNAACLQTRRDVTHEIAVEVVRNMGVAKLLEHRERVLDPLLFHHFLKTANCIATIAKIHFGEYRLCFAILRRFADLISGCEHFSGSRVMFVNRFRNDSYPFVRTGALRELRFLTRHLLAQVRKLLLGRGQFRCRFHLL